MSVYQDRNGKYVYDFQCRGLRFFGTTDCRTRREAERLEATERDKARQTVAKLEAQRSAPMTVSVALDRFWLEKGDGYTGTYRQTVWTSLAWLLEQLGAETAIAAIGPAKVTELVGRRRAEGVKNATVNRTVTELLRTILRRAHLHWEQDVARIDWRLMILREPRERVRELRDHEEDKLDVGMREDYRPAIEFAKISGCRKKEIVGLKWSDVDWTARTITIRGKGDKFRRVPLSDALRALLAPLRDHHPRAVFTYVARATRDRRMHGARYPITYSGLSSAWRRYGPAELDIEDFRFHDLRHTTGTRLLRETGNIKLVQKLLGHEDITTTAKYAHADDADLRRGMDAVDQARPQLRKIAGDE